MAGSWRIVAGTLVLFSITVASADAFHGRSGSWPSASARPSYYLAAPVYYYYYCPMPAIVVPVPDAIPRYANPTPAPPSSTGEPPLGANDPRAPKIITRSAGANLAAAKDRCRVGFWNLAGRDVMVTIEGKAWSLPKNQVLTFDLERHFTWQVAGQTQQVERVPGNVGAHEVIIRE